MNSFVPSSFLPSFSLPRTPSASIAMSSQNGAKTPASEKPLTPAQSAKPYGTAAKEAASAAARRAPPKKTTDASLSDSPADVAKDDAIKAIAKLETRLTAVYVDNQYEQD